MVEQLDLTTPIPATAATNDYEVEELYLRRGRVNGAGGRVEIQLVANNGDVLHHIYRDEKGETVASDLMRALNKADLSTNSLHKRILDRLVADGVLDGTVSGAPD